MFTLNNHNKSSTNKSLSIKNVKLHFEFSPSFSYILLIFVTLSIKDPLSWSLSVIAHVNHYQNNIVIIIIIIVIIIIVIVIIIVVVVVILFYFIR